MAPLTVKKSLQQFRSLHQKLAQRLEELMGKKDSLELVLTSFSASESEQKGSQHTGAAAKHEKNRLTAAATDILIEILNLKVEYVEECIGHLEEKVRANTRSMAPAELRVTRFEDWVETNQRLHQLNSKLYEIEKVKVNIERKENREVRRPLSLENPDASITSTVSELAATALKRVLNRYNSSTMPKNLHLYVSSRLNHRGNRETLESSKIEEYIKECEEFPGTLQNPPVDTNGDIRGAHPTSYHSFVKVLCNYITERHQETQGEDLPYSTVYTAIEHHLVPRIMAYILPYIRDEEKDQRVRQQCERFADVTLEQLGVARPLWTTDLIPFAGAIAHMRATFFSQSPTDKMYSVVSSAKALYDSLGTRTESIDGDTFMDLWVYVAIKANVKDMATNMTFMMEYGNPQLSLDEAGYYLTTLSGAMNFIENITPEKLLPQRSNNENFVVCEPERAKELAALPNSPFKVVKQDVLSGYQVAVVRDWVLDRTRIFHSVLVKASDPETKLPVTVISVTREGSTPQHVQYFYDKLSESDVNGITVIDLPQGTAMVCEHVQKDKLVMVQSGCVEEHLRTITYSLQLIRLGSEQVESFEEHRQLPSVTSSSLTTSNFKNEPDLRLRDRFTMPARGNLKKPKKSYYRARVSNGSSDGNMEQVPASPPVITVTAEVHIDSSQTLPNLSPSPSPSSTESPSPPPPTPPPRVVVTSEERERCLMDREFIERLESNFTTNYFHENKPESVREAMVEITKHAQLLLQRLNFLSPIHKLDGCYDDITMAAVIRFQRYSNDEDLFSATALPESGVLTVATYQLLKQQLLTTFTNMVKIGREFGLTTKGNLNPLSTDPEDGRRFKEVLGKFQVTMKMNHCRQGVMCSKTVSLIQRMLRLRSNSLNGVHSYERGMTM